ncbi:T9SS C-terminal target domain-containing protein [Paraflavitalea soli]|uniref:T9SS C-terminal target domain-containing protein n=1 Tax=Paraflavitalea soli TaxID=2315862 RepID=A0A3B7N130_9BACT|nr:T9SS type A sorting domain-containing protein [Paraflavitalea soli]AXY77745.1 T9SS C-terminal target domain-containing protein [Paraflavitalea soli]
MKKIVRSRSCANLATHRSFSMKGLVRLVLAGTLLTSCLSTAQAQLGNGWKSYSPTKKVHLDDADGLQIFNYTTYKSVCDPICADYRYDADTDTETFRILTTKSNRSEIRLQNDYSTGSRQFEGYVTFNAPLNDESLMQIFGSVEGATQMMIRGYAAEGGSMRGAGQTLATNIYGREVKVNVIHMQEDVGNKIQIYINDTLRAEIPDNEPVSNYHKYGNYGTMKTGEAVVKWRQARFFRDGVPPGEVPPPVNTNSFDITDNGGIITAQFANTSKPSENFPSLIDNSSSTKYYQSGKKALWVQYESKAPAVVVKYTLTSANDVPERDPKDWSLLASNNGTNWDTLDTKSGELFASRRLKRTFLLDSNITRYIYYRLDITANNGQTGTQFAEWELIEKRFQVVTLDSIPDKTFGDGPFELTAGSSAELPVTFEVVSGPATINDNAVSLTGGGLVTIRASQAGNEQYFPASTERTFTVARAAQTLTFATITDQLRSASVLLNGMASSGLPVQYIVTEGPAYVQGDTLRFNGEGKVTVKAVQEGNENYLPANTITQSFMVYGTENKTGDFRLVIAPNPTKGPLSAIIINKKRDKQYNFYLYDFNGRLIQTCVIAKNSVVSIVHFNLAQEPNGQYYLQVTNGIENLVRIIIKQ